MRNTKSRCDQIVALIDECLADYELATTRPDSTRRERQSPRSPR